MNELETFIISGYIPGTHFQVSFWQVLLLGLLLWLSIRIYRRPLLRRKYSHWAKIAGLYARHFRALRSLH